MENLKELTFGGLFAVLLLREVFGYLRALKNGNGKHGCLFSAEALRKAFEEALDNRLRPYVNKVDEAMTSVRTSSHETRNSMADTYARVATSLVEHREKMNEKFESLRRDIERGDAAGD